MPLETRLYPPPFSVEDFFAVDSSLLEFVLSCTLTTLAHSEVWAGADRD